MFLLLRNRAHEVEEAQVEVEFDDHTN